MSNKHTSLLIIFILFPLAAGSLSSVLSGNMAGSTFTKVPLSPPGYIFPIVWTILYTLMGISSHLVFTSGQPAAKSGLQTYLLQLFFNFLWSILFFRFEMYWFAFIWLLILIILILQMIRLFYSIKPISAYLQIPYLLWCIFASYLNFMIAGVN